MTFDEVRHLVSRTAFGGIPVDIRRLMALDRRAAVAQVLAIPTNRAHTPPPPWLHMLPPPPNVRKFWSERERKAFQE